MVSGWVCGTARWEWKSSKALLSGYGGRAWGRQMSWLWQVSAEGNREMVWDVQVVQNYQFFHTNPLSNCQIPVRLLPITDNPHQSNDLLGD